MHDGVGACQFSTSGIGNAGNVMIQPDRSDQTTVRAEDRLHAATCTLQLTDDVIVILVSPITIMALPASPSPMAKHLVVPGQIIAVSSDNDEGAAEGFLRGHGTYIETIPGTDGGPSPARAVVSSGAGGGADDDDSDGAAAGGGGGGGGGGGTKRLVASVAGTVERVNKLVSVVPLSSSVYAGQVGDLVVGRISAVGPTRWRVALSLSPSGAGAGLGRAAQLPLSGADLPGGVQRIRTAEDARGMRRLYGEGDLLSAEVQQVAQADGTLVLHTRSLRYGRLENGCAVQVPPGLVRRMRQHMCTLAGIGVDGELS